MQVLAGRERLDQPGVVGQVGHDPHLDLAVVGRHQQFEAGADGERLADAPALGRAHRDVLQVRVGGRQPAGGGDGLVERGVDAALVVDQRQQPVDHGLEPGDLAVAQQQLEHRVLGLDVEVGQRVGVGGVAGLDPLGLRQPELVEQDLLQLLGRAQVERAADHACGRPARPPSRARRVRPAGRAARRCRWRCRPPPCRPARRSAAAPCRPAAVPRPRPPARCRTRSARSRTALARTVSTSAIASSDSSTPPSRVSCPDSSTLLRSSRCR